MSGELDDVRAAPRSLRRYVRAGSRSGPLHEANGRCSFANRGDHDGHNR